MRLRERGSYPVLLTANDTWVHHFEPETKSRPWKGTILNLPGRKNFGKSPAAGKVKITAFLDCGGVSIVTVTVTDCKRANNFRCLLQAVLRTRETFHTNLVSQDFLMFSSTSRLLCGTHRLLFSDLMFF